MKLSRNLVCTGLFFFIMMVSIQIAYGYNLPDTGQTKCYDNAKEIPCPQPGEAFYGQDANYQGAQPAYRDNGDGTVTDLKTELIGRKRGSEQRPKAMAEGHGLWRGWPARHSDWRLPTMRELQSMVTLDGASSRQY